MAVRGWIGAVVAGSALVAATAAGATGGEPAPANNVSGVTVTPDAKPNPLVDPTSQYVKERLPESTFSDQLSRFHDAICVKVQGLPDEFDTFVAKRLIEVATQTGVPIAEASGCIPNINVIFSTHPQAQIADIARRRDDLIGFYYQAQFKRVGTFSRPIQAWYATKVIDSAGNEFSEIRQTCPYAPRLGIPACDRPQGRAGSRLGADMTAEIVHSLIIADASKVAGEKIDAVADYVAVLALARWTGLERCSRIPTVLNLLADSCDGSPEAATPQDLALLKALYSVDPREFGFQQRATVASAIRAADKTH